MQPVVLCGGQSSRMGSDKGLLLLEADTWVQTSVDCLSVFEPPALISVNQNQFNTYRNIFKEELLVVDNDSLQLKGPLKGVLSVHLCRPTDDLIVLACDMPLMTKNTIMLLNNSYEANPGYDAYVFTNNDLPEPLCAIYTAKGLSSIHEEYKQGKLLKHSMKYMIAKLNSFFIPIPNELLNDFRNFNAHSELNGL